MKRKLLLSLIFLFSLFSFTVRSQSYSDGYSLTFGAVQNGIGGLFSYNYFLDRHDFFEASILLTASNYKYLEDIKIPYNDFTVNIGYSKNVFYNYQNTFNVNLSAGGIFGYETLNKGDKNLSNGALILSKPGFIYGGYIGIDLDVSLSNRTSIIVKGNEFFHANSSLGQFIPYVGIGLRLYPN